ncbi:MAG TPA: YfjI family protein [Agitococcus sp.]|nr:YfjI family protein [Agitococcus sp.]HMY00443.1 YfjI family protein [Agitococcus sp.]HMY28059.1 YfjI family protein [Agitococcus sp.]HNC02622.1 YfjI family protein [Agitococcus sp.]HNH43361.1 YfjI family protein [Agitococcus sp.]
MLLKGILMINNKLRTIPVPNKSDPVAFFQNAVKEVVQNTQAPEDMVQLCALAAISTVIQRLIKVKLPGVGVVPTSLMLMIVAKSGERKSAVESKFFNPIREFEQSKRIVYEKDYQQWKAEHEVWEIERKAVQKKLDKAITTNAPSEEIDVIRAELTQKIAQELKKPTPIKILYDDSTSQALYSGLKNGLLFAGLISSEGGSVLKSGVFSDMAKLNSLWSGESITIDRVKAESIHISDARLTTLIMVQPEILADYMDKKGEQARGSGLIARFLFSSGQSTQGTRLMEDYNQEPRWEYLERFNYLIKEFLESSYQSSLKEAFNPQILELSPAAEKLWITYYNNIERHINIGGVYDSFGDHASKLAENAGRIAALLNYFHWNSNIIGSEVMEYAINCCDNLSKNFLVFFNVQPQEIQDAEKLLEWLNDTIKYQFHKSRSIKKNDILKYGPSFLRKSERLNKALEVLLHNGSIYFFQDMRRTTYVGLNLYQIL